MFYIAAILFAALPHSDNPWAQSAFIFFGTVCVAHWLHGFLTAVTNNQKKIYSKLG